MELTNAENYEEHDVDDEFPQRCTDMEFFVLSCIVCLSCSPQSCGREEERIASTFSPVNNR